MYSVHRTVKWDVLQNVQWRVVQWSVLYIAQYTMDVLYNTYIQWSVLNNIAIYTYTER